MRSVQFCNFTQGRMVVCYWRFETPCRPHLQGSSRARMWLNLEYGTDRLSRNVGNNTTILHCVKLHKSADLKLSNTFKHSQKMHHISAAEMRVLMAPGKKIATCYWNYANPTGELHKREVLVTKTHNVRVISNVCKRFKHTNSCHSFRERILSFSKFVTPAPHPPPTIPHPAQSCSNSWSHSLLFVLIIPTKLNIVELNARWDFVPYGVHFLLSEFQSSCDGNRYRDCSFSCAWMLYRRTIH